MELFETIFARRSVRAFTAERIPEEDADRILEAGRFAATGRNRQPCYFVYLTAGETCDRIRRMNAEVMGTEGDPYYGAPQIVLVLADGAESGTIVEDGALALGNMMLAARALGVGSCWIHREKQIFESEEGRALLREWNLPETCVGIGALALGYPAEGFPEARARREDNIRKIK